MARYARNTAILAKVESTAGTDAGPVNTTDAVLVSNVSVTPLDAQNVDRDLIRGYLGSSQQLVGRATKKITFEVEMAGSGTAATAPEWGDLLLGCGWAETTGLTTPNRVEYLPATDNLKTLTIYAYDSGVLHKLLGAMGNVKFNVRSGERPMMQFEFTAIDGGDTAVAVPTPTLTNWKIPVTVTAANVTTDVTLGCTYATGALSGGTAYPSLGLEIDMANRVSYMPTLTSQRVDLNDRQPQGKVSLDLTAAQEVTFITNVKANTTQGLGFILGTATGNKILLHAPAAQLFNPSLVANSGSRLIGFDMRITPSAGNDELRIVHL